MQASSLRGSGWKLVLALGAVYFIWGSTYLGIRIAIETLPPFLMAGVRFLVAGALLLAWAGWKGASLPTAAIWRTSAVSGVLMFLGGNGAVVWAEQFVPSGLVALLVATVPLWIVLQDWAFGKGGPPGIGLSFGIIWGFAGVGILVTGGEIGMAGRDDLFGGLLVLLGAACWSAGSLVARYGPRPASAAVGIGVQKLAGGGALLLLGLVRGEVAALDPSGISAASVLAFAYLVVFGSLIGFSSYIWLLRNTTPAVASTYAYVNPAVALLLGWAVVGEPMSLRIGLAAFVILSAVIVITTQRTRGAPPRKGARWKKNRPSQEAAHFGDRS
ncbi:MAG: EamA family transporter [Gemmatimonadetes bacterium]|nr:EamA family transporter [Gemmatimonadota bacterium]